MLRPCVGEKHSLWLMPRGDAYDRLARIIHDLGARHGGPEFAPHVTLLGGCVGTRGGLIRQSAQLAAALRPFPLRLGEIDFRPEYFRCLFIHAALAMPLRKAHAVACRVFGRQSEPPFLPHLSLLYGDFPADGKESIKAELGGRLDLQFHVRSLHLYRTAGDPRQWRPVEVFGLQ